MLFIRLKNTLKLFRILCLAVSVLTVMGTALEPPKKLLQTCQFSRFGDFCIGCSNPPKLSRPILQSPDAPSLSAWDLQYLGQEKSFTKRIMCASFGCPTRRPTFARLSHYCCVYCAFCSIELFEYLLFYCHFRVWVQCLSIIPQETYSARRFRRSCRIARLPTRRPSCRV